VLINESTMRFFTGKDGKVSFHVIGKAQRQTIPDDAPAVDKEFVIRLRAQPEEAGLGSMANIFFGGLGIITGGAAGFLSSLIDVLKTFTYDMGERALPVTDWGTQGWKIKDWVPGLQNLSGGITLTMTGGLSCSSPFGPWDFSSESTDPTGSGFRGYTIPFSEGNSTGSVHDRATRDKCVFDSIGTFTVSITPNTGGYRMEMGPPPMAGTVCCNGVCQSYNTTLNAWGVDIVPADPGQCTQP
jgi:hypothetical protein